MCVEECFWNLNVYMNQLSILQSAKCKWLSLCNAMDYTVHGILPLSILLKCKFWVTRSTGGCLKILHVESLQKMLIPMVYGPLFEQGESSEYL